MCYKSLFHEDFEQANEHEDGHTGDQDKHDLFRKPGPENTKRFTEGAKEVHQLRQLLKGHIDKIDEAVQDLAKCGLQQSYNTVADCAQ